MAKPTHDRAATNARVPAGGSQPSTTPPSTETSESLDADAITRVGTDPSVPPSETTRRLIMDAEQLVGRYVVRRLLGVGGMGAVYLVYDPKLGRDIALKLLRPDPALVDDDPEAEVRVVREAQAMAKLSHPNVLPVYDVEVLDDAVFITMEFVDGHTLRTWMQTPRTTKEVLEVFRQAGLGLAAAHAAGIVHRDFKPANILVGNDGLVRVMDFGLARLSETSETDSSSRLPVQQPSASSSSLDSISVSQDVLSAAITQVGAIVGTPAYMAPEQHAGSAPDVLSDQFSYCVALFEALYGTRPFPAKRSDQLERAKQRGRISELPAHHRVPPWIYNVVARGLAPDPQQRWPSMPVLLAALDDDPLRRRRRWLAAAAGVAGLAAVIGMAMHRRDRDVASCHQAALVVNVADPLTRLDKLVGVGTSSRSDHLREDVLHYVERWTHERRDACEATYVRHEQSPELLDMRTRCLDSDRTKLDALLDVLEHSVPTELDVGQAAQRLPDPRRCRDRSRLMLAFAPEHHLPPEFERRFAKAAANVQAGPVDVAMEATARVLAASQQTDQPLLEAAARLEYAQALTRADNDRGAVEQAQLAYYDALAHGDDHLALAAATQIVSVLARQSSQAEAALRWADHALALTQRNVDDPLRRAELQLARAIAAARTTAYDDADGWLDTLPEHLAETRPDLSARARLWRGLVVLFRGRHEGLGLARDAVAMAEQVFGPDQVPALAVQAELGWALAEFGSIDDAIHELGEAVTGMERQLGPEHPLVLRFEVDHAAALRRSEQWPLAQIRLSAAIDRLARQPHGDGRSLARARRELGEVYLQLGDATSAREVLEPSYAYALGHRNDEPLAFATTTFAYAQALAADPERADETLRLAQQAEEILIRTLGRESTRAREIANWRASRIDGSRSTRPPPVAQGQ